MIEKKQTGDWRWFPEPVGHRSTRGLGRDDYVVAESGPVRFGVGTVGGIIAAGCLGMTQ